MSRTFRQGVVLIALVGVTLLTNYLPAQAVDAVPTARLLPPEVTIYATMPNVSEFKERWKQSLFGQLRQDPDLADFWSDVEEQLKEASSQLEQKLGLSVNDLLQLPSGEVSVAVVQPAGKKFAIVGFLDFGDNEEIIEKLVQRRLRLWKRNRRTPRVRSRTLRVLVLRSIRLKSQMTAMTRIRDSPTLSRTHSSSSAATWPFCNRFSCDGMESIRKRLPTLKSTSTSMNGAPTRTRRRF